VILLEAGGNHLVAQLAEDMAHDQAARTSSTTVGGRFRDQLRDLIARLDQCAHAPASLVILEASKIKSAAVAQLHPNLCRDSFKQHNLHACRCRRVSHGALVCMPLL
jgi:hypothetical protein